MKLGFTTYPISFRTPVRSYDLGDILIPEDTVLLAFTGSVAHGMFVDPEDPNCIGDVDLVGVSVPSQQYYLGLSEWGSRGTKRYQAGVWDGVYYEVRKIVSMLLQGNPNVMSLLWAKPEHRLILAPAAEILLKHRNAFLGRHVFNAFAEYASAQLVKMESRDPAELREYLAVTAELKYRGVHPNHKGEFFERPSGELTGEATNAVCWDTEKLVTRLRHFQKKGENIGYMGDKRKRLVLQNGYDSKNAAHCIRLLRMCIEFLTSGMMAVYRPDAGDAQELLAIKRGEWPLEAVKAEAQKLFAQARKAYEESKLPDQPDRVKAEYILMTMIQTWWHR